MRSCIAESGKITPLRKWWFSLVKIIPAKNPNSADRRYINVYAEALISLVAMIARDNFVVSVQHVMPLIPLDDIDDIGTDTCYQRCRYRYRLSIVPIQYIVALI